jgi:hypothetical protein
LPEGEGYREIFGFGKTLGRVSALEPVHWNVVVRGCAANRLDL